MRASFPDSLDEARIISGTGTRKLSFNSRLLSISSPITYVSGARHTHTTMDEFPRAFSRTFSWPRRRRHRALLGTLRRRLIDAGWRTKMADLLHFQSRVSPRVSRRQNGSRRTRGLSKINMSTALLRSSNRFLKGDKIKLFLKAGLFIYLFITPLFFC